MNFDIAKSTTTSYKVAYLVIKSWSVHNIRIHDKYSLTASRKNIVA